jgi:hypothetical protein
MAKWKFTGSSDYSNNLGGIIFKNGQVTDYEEMVKKFPSFFELVVEEESKVIIEDKILKIEVESKVETIEPLIVKVEEKKDNIKVEEKKDNINKIKKEVKKEVKTNKTKKSK